MDSVQAKIERLKREKNAIILAHYYVDAAVKEIADCVGDSYYLAKRAAETNARTLVFCGVRFMGESAKILNRDKRVLLPDPAADCAMAHMATAEQIERYRQEYSDLAVVCYINSTAALKTHCDVCVTSSNALKIVRALPQKNILLIPDDNLGRFIAAQVPEKNFYFTGGCCPVHAALLPEDVLAVKAAHPQAAVLAHPECKQNVLALADYVGSTAGILAYAQQSAARELIVCTENGVFSDLRAACPGKEFYLPAREMCCSDMKKITLEKVLSCLETGAGEVILNAEIAERAAVPLQAMLQLAR